MHSPNAQKQAQLAYYDQGAADYEKTRTFLTRGLNRASSRKAHIIAKELASRPHASVLEVGAGSGLVSHFLQKKLPMDKYVLMDLSEQMLAQAKTRMEPGKTEFEVGDIAATLFPADEFDAIVGTDIIHHLEDPVTAMKEWLRISKPGAKLTILETNAYNPLILQNIGVEHEVRSFLNTDKNLKRWLTEAGWSDVRVKPAPSFTPSGPPPFGYIWDVIDWVSVRIPIYNRLAALWKLTAVKG